MATYPSTVQAARTVFKISKAILWQAVRIVLLLVPDWVQESVVRNLDTPIGCQCVGNLIERLHQFWLRTPWKVMSRYKYETSTSPLLSLPPEIRLQIWQEALGREVIEIVYSYQCRCRNHGSPICPQFRMLSYRNPKVLPNTSLFRVCRQIYSETDYEFYTRKTFCFPSSATFSDFFHNLTIVQRGYIRKVWMRVAEGDQTQSSLTLNALQLRFDIGLLPSLRRLDIFTIQRNPTGDKYMAQGVFHLLWGINATCSVKITMSKGISGCTECTWYKWPYQYRKDFVDNVWERVRHPDSEIRRQTDETNSERPCYRIGMPLQDWAPG